MKARRYILAILAALAAGAIGSLATLKNIPTWYAALIKPSWTPPNWVFGPVWTALYILMGISAGLVWNSPRAGKGKVLALFFVHLIVNATWSFAFFGLHQTLAALLIIKLLWVLIAVLMIVFWRYSKSAAWLLLPYLLWVTYAATLNYGVVILNP